MKHIVNDFLFNLYTILYYIGSCRDVSHAKDAIRVTREASTCFLIFIFFYSDKYANSEWYTRMNTSLCV